jgi:hypothetical protein
MAGLGEPVDAAPSECAYPYPLEARMPSTSAENRCSNDDVGTKISLDVTIEDGVVEAVALG